MKFRYLSNKRMIKYKEICNIFLFYLSTQLKVINSLQKFSYFRLKITLLCAHIISKSFVFVIMEFTFLFTGPDILYYIFLIQLKNTISNF